MGDLGIGLLVLGWVNDLNTPVIETLSGYSAGLHVDRPGSRGVQNLGSRSCTPPTCTPPRGAAQCTPLVPCTPLPGAGA